MQAPSPIACAWLAFPVASYYLVRPLRSQALRFGITTAGCAVLTHLGTKEIEPGFMSGMLRTSLYWMSSIRLVDLMTRPDEERDKMSLKTFVSKFTHFLLPISANPTPRPLREHLLHLAQYAGLFASKVVIGGFVRTWFLRCSLLSGGGEVARHNYWLTVQLTAIMAAGIFLGSAMNDAQIFLVSALTRDRYQVLEFNRWPVLATSFREFWSKRYNLLVSGLFHESVFVPLRRELRLSKEAAAFATFAVSGALHAHVVRVCFSGGARDVIAGFAFFALQGLFCLAEARLAPRAGESSPVLGAAVTQIGLLLTAPLYLGQFVYASPAWVLNNPPDVRSPVELTVPGWIYCPKP